MVQLSPCRSVGSGKTTNSTSNKCFKSHRDIRRTSRTMKPQFNQRFLIGLAGITLVFWTNPGQSQMLSSADADRWYKEGIFPSRVTIPIQKLPAPETNILIPLPGLALKSGKNWPACWAYIFNRPVTDAGYLIGFSIGPNRFARFPVSHIWYNGPNQLEFGVKDGVVFPLYEGMVYRADIDETSLSLVRVNHVLPENIRPLPDSRCLSSNCLNAVLSSHRMNSPKFMNPVVGMNAEELSFDNQHAKVAKIRWVRHAWEGRQVVASELKEYFSLFVLPEKIEQSIRAGDVIETNVYSFKVRKVVPPQEIDGAGSLTGWIELQRTLHDTTSP